MFNFFKSKTDAELVDLAVKAFKSGKILEAKQLLGPLIEKNYPPAYYQMGVICEVADKDYSTAFCNYMKASLYDLPMGHYARANCLMLGQGTFKCADAALEYYQKAATAGVPEACFVLGEFYRAGKDVERDTKAAKEWYSRAVKLGYAPAQKRLDQLMADPATEAPIKQTTQANPKADSVKVILVDAAYEAKILKNRDDFGFIPEAEPIITGGTNQIFEAVSGAAKAAGNYHPDIVNRAARYLFGKAIEAVILWGRAPNGKFKLFFDSSVLVSEDVFKGLPEDYKNNIQGAALLADQLFEAHTKWLSAREQALDTVKLGAEIKELFTWCSRIGMAYALENKYHEFSSSDKSREASPMNLSEEIMGVAANGAALVEAKEYEKAMPLLLKAAEAGHVAAQYGLAMLHFHGLGTKRNPHSALKWLLKAAELGLPNAQHQASILISNGVGCVADPEKSFFWAQKAAAQNFPEAVFNVGMLYMKGTGVAQNFIKAIEYICKAAHLGHPKAIQAMKEMGDKGQ